MATADASVTEASYLSGMTRTSPGTIRLLCIGDARIETESGAIDSTANVLFATALYLILEAAKPTSRVALAELLWPDASTHTRMHRLRQTLLKLRRSGVVIDSLGKSLIRIAHSPINLEHEEVSKRDTSSWHLGHSLRPLPGFEPHLSNEYEQWLESKRGQIIATVASALLGDIAKYRYGGEWSAVEACATSLLQIAPLNEEATLALAEALAMRGSKHSATQLLDAYIQETGGGPTDLKVQATLMRRRIADRLAPRATNASSELPLVGRSETMTELASHITSAKTGNGDAFIVLGDAGIGKTRVLEEFTRFATLQGFSSIRIHCRPSFINRPLSAFLELVPLLRSLPGAIGCSPETLQFLERLTRHEPKQDEVRPDNAEPAWIFGGIQRALFDMVEAVADENPLLIQVEDTHWLDAASADLLREMIDRVPTRVLFGLTARETNDEWKITSPRALRIVHLAPINNAQASDLLANIARQHGKVVQNSYVEWCVRVAEGNPYFLTELATHWVETGVEHDVPPSLSAVLNNRIARLDRKSIQLLQTCALLENNSTLPRIEAVLEYEAFELLASIETLGSAGMIVVDQGEGLQNERLASKHELLSSAAVMQLSVPARRFLHRRVGQVLEREIDEHYSASTLWDCAKHWQLAGDTRRAFQLATSCASYLMKVGLPVEAAAAYEKTLPFCTSDEQRLDILKAQTSAFYGMSAWSSVIETSSKVRSLQKRRGPAVSTHDEIELMDLRAQWQTFDWHSVLITTTQCLYASDASIEHRAEAGVMALMLSGMQCNRDASTQIHNCIEEMISAGGVPDSTMLKARMVYHVDHGNIDEGVSAALQLVAEQRARGDIGEVFRGELNAAMACRVAGRFSEAEQLYLSAIELATSHGLAFAEQRALPLFAHMALEIGRVDQAKELYDRLIRISDGGFDQLRFIQQQALGVRLALCEDRGVDAMNLLPFSLSEIADDPIFSKRTYNLALLVAVELALSGIASKEATACLEESFKKARTTQHQAFSAFVLYAALCQTGDVNRASQTLSEYEANFRREPWPAPRHLLNTIEGGLQKSGTRLAS